MADAITITFTDQVGPLLARSEPRIRRAITLVVRQTATKALQRIKNKTPRDRGTAAAGWGMQLQGEEALITNDVPYINVLEHGGYPVQSAARVKAQPPGSIKRGNAYLGGSYPPGPRTVRADSNEPIMLQGSNVSKGAPHGMARVVLGEIDPEFAFDLEEAIDQALNGPGGGFGGGVG